MLDHQLIAREKYEAVVNGLDHSADPIELYFAKPGGGTMNVEVSALAEKYLGRRIVLVFFRDVTQSVKMIREMRAERETFKNAFEKGLLPVFILNHKGYISLMNQAALDLFHLTEKDKAFYRNVYIRPLLTLEVRRKIKQGLPAEMDYEFDFAKAGAAFPGRIIGEGKINLHATLIAFNRRIGQDGQVRADYLVTLECK